MTEKWNSKSDTQNERELISWMSLKIPDLTNDNFRQNISNSMSGLQHVLYRPYTDYRHNNA